MKKNLQNLPALPDGGPASQTPCLLTEQARMTYLAGDLAAILAHELAQPLSAIASYACACRMMVGSATPAASKVGENLDQIVSQAKRASEIIRCMRGFFQNSAMEITAIDMAVLIDDVLKILDDEILQANAIIDIQIQPSLVAAIDHIQVEQVLINLIRNSLEALSEIPMNERQIHITACRSVRGDIEVTIHDTGPGIASEIVDQLFNSPVTTRKSGIGLGLMVSRSIIEAHNGDLWIELRSAASGTIMCFTLPAFE